MSDVDTILREAGGNRAQNLPLLPAIAPDGAGVERSNVGSEGIADMADLLAGVAIEAADRNPKTSR